MQYKARKICDIGGGANPVLPLQFIINNQLDCTILDISSAELEKAPIGYKKLVQDIETENSVQTNQFDLVVSKMMAEHLKNGKLFHKTFFDIESRWSGYSLFSHLVCIAFSCKQVNADRISSFLLDIFLPRDRYQMGKFPAHYSWCYGPTPSMLRMLSEIGYEIEQYRGFFGNIYYSRIPILRNVYKVYTRYLVNHPNPYLTSFAQVVLRKPENNFADITNRNQT